MKNNLSLLTSDQSIICPYCTKLLFVNDKIGDSFKEFELIELECPKCNLKFTFIFCIHCNQKIYLKFYQNNKENKGNKEVNLINGHNFKCPYSNCGKYFYFTKCVKCKKLQKIPNFVYEGNSVKCQFQQCGYEYLQIKCPVKNCEELWNFEKPSKFNNNPAGISYNHKSELTFQKINCAFCLNPIVFYSSKNRPTKYYEGQLVICPYCEKKFSRIICPDCHIEIIFQNLCYKMGRQIHCKKCDCSFLKLLCPKCNRICIEKKRNFFFGAMKCGFRDCLKESYLLNCLYCSRLNYFDFKEAPVVGQRIKCGYKNCQRSFNVVVCPSCNRINPFTQDNYFYFGKRFTCIYQDCKKTFQYLLCPKCFSYSPKIDGLECQKFKCSVCGSIIANFVCPFCKVNLLDINSTLNFGQLISCPNCLKKFSFTRCFNCHQLIYSKEGKNLFGVCIRCENEKCGAYNSNAHCPDCKKRTILTGQRNNLKEGDDVKCANCNKVYKFSLKNEYDEGGQEYKGKLIVLEEKIGHPLDLNIGEKDENFINTENYVLNVPFLYKNSNEFYNESEKENKITSKEDNESTNDNNINTSANNIIKCNCNCNCVVCHNGPNETVFIPCGHKCSCYDCAEEIINIERKCPKCSVNSRNIIKKIYD